MGRYFGNVRPESMMDTFAPAFTQALTNAMIMRRQNTLDAQAQADRQRSQRYEDFAFSQANPGTTALPTSFRQITPGSLPNPVDGLDVSGAMPKAFGDAIAAKTNATALNTPTITGGVTTPGANLPTPDLSRLSVSSTPTYEFSGTPGQGFVTDVRVRDAEMNRRLTASLTSALLGAQAKAQGTALGDPLGQQVKTSTIYKNNADGTKAIADATKPDQPIMGSPAWQDAKRFEAGLVKPPSDHFVFPTAIDPVTGKPTVFRGNTVTGDLTPTGALAKGGTDPKTALKDQSNISMMGNAYQTMAALSDRVSPAKISFAIKSPTMGNATLNQDEQSYLAAARNFLVGALHLEGGARLTAEQWEIGLQRYFPAFGDTPETKRTKLANAKMELDGMRQAAGTAAPPDTTTPPDSGDNPWRP